MYVHLVVLKDNKMFHGWKRKKEFMNINKPLSTSLFLASRHFLATSRKGEPEGCLVIFLADVMTGIKCKGYIYILVMYIYKIT